MAKIDPDTLRYFRESRRWSLDQLSQKAKINKQTVWRLENNSKTRTQERVIRQIAAALEVEAGVLTGEMPIPETSKRSDLPPTKSQLSLRLAVTHRNALNLVASRYRIKPAQIIELAPFLFFCAAETSLRKRAERLKKFEHVLAEAESIGDDFRHLPSINYFPYSDEAVEAERISISQRDLFGARIELSELGVESKFDGKSNPFAVHLRCMASEFTGQATFEEWDGDLLPHYRVGAEEAAALVGGDADRVEEILSGEVALKDIPQELRKSEMIRERVQWIEEKAQEYREQLERDLADLFALFEREGAEALPSDEPTEV